MPKLPGVEDMSGLPSGRSGRPIARIDTTAAGEGLAAAGAGLASAGNDMLRVQAYQDRQAEVEAERLRREREKVEAFALQSRLLEFEEQKQTAYLAEVEDAEAGAAGFSARFMTNFDADAKRLWQAVPERLKPEYDLKFRAMQSRFNEAATKFEMAERDRFAKGMVGDGQERLLSRLAVDPGNWREVEKEGETLIRNRPGASPIESDVELRAWKQLREAASLEILKRDDPFAAKDAITPSGGWIDALQSRESGGRPDIKNEFGYAGLYQFGAPRLAALGVYAPGQGESLKSWSRTSSDAPGKWSGTFDIPGFPEVRTLSDFLASRDAQNEVLRLHTAKMEGEIASNGLDRFIGETVGGVTVTRPGLMSAMHLAGANGVRRYLESGGTEDAEDANGTAISDYLAMGGKAGESGALDPRFSGMSFADRLSAGRAIDAEIARRQTEYLSGFEDYISFLRDGNSPDGRFSPDESARYLGQAKAGILQGDIDEAAAYGEDVKATRFASPAELQAIVAARQAETASPDEYRAKRQDLAGLVNLIEKRNAALVDDPAQYALQDPEIEASYRAMLQSDGDPQASRTYATSVLALQERMGLPPEARRILPAATVAEIVRQFRRSEQGGQNPAQLMQVLEAQWGRQWPRVFGELSGDLPATALVIGAMNRPNQARAAEQLAEAALAGAPALEKLHPAKALGDLKEAIAGQLVDFAVTVDPSLIPGGQETYAAFYEGAYLLGLSYMSGGALPEQAARRAYDDVLGKAYEFRGTFRVPVDEDAALVERGSTRIMDSLGDLDIDLPISLMGLNPEQTKSAYLSGIRSRGFWVTAPDETGLVLYDEMRAAVTVKGRPLVVPWDDLVKAATIQPSLGDIETGQPEWAEPVIGEP